MKKLFLFIAFCLGALSMQADVYTDGIAKRVAAGQITITISDGPIMQDFFERTPEQMKQGIIEYIASLFRKNMTEKEFSDWMKYKPTKKDITYKENVDKMLETIQKQADNLMNSQDIVIKLAAGQDVPRITAKECTPAYKQAFEQFLAVNEVNATLHLQQWKIKLDNAGTDPQSATNIEYLLNKRAYPICYDNVIATLLNTSIDNYSEKQLKEYGLDLPFAKALKAIVAEATSNLNPLMEAAYGLPVNQWDARMNEKGAALQQKYGRLEDNFKWNVNFSGIKRFYE